MDLIIGSHVSFKNNTQLYGSAIEALSYGANTFMIYTGAPQNTKRDQIDESLTAKAYNLMKDNNININNIIVHAPYIINLANNDNASFAVSFLKQEIKRCEELGISKIVLHPGSHVGLGIDSGISNIIEALNEAMTKDQTISICLETMSGKGSECGGNFFELKQIIDGVTYNDKLLVCMDTCHMNDAGYDMTNFDKVLKEFDEIVGLKKLGCIHINDSKNLRGQRKDRHENIGLGTIGFDNLIKIIYHKELVNIPKILETPYVADENTEDKTYPPYKWEIKMIRDKVFDNNLLDHIRGH